MQNESRLKSWIIHLSFGCPPFPKWRECSDRDRRSWGKFQSGQDFMNLLSYARRLVPRELSIFSPVRKKSAVGKRCRCHFPNVVRAISVSWSVGEFCAEMAFLRVSSRMLEEDKGRVWRKSFADRKSIFEPDKSEDHHGCQNTKVPADLL